MIKPRVARAKSEEDFINGATSDTPVTQAVTSKPQEAVPEEKAKGKGTSRPLSLSVTDHHYEVLDKSIAEALMNGLSGIKRSDIAKAQFLVWERLDMAERVRILKEMFSKK